jgi:hypothetical protein
MLKLLKYCAVIAVLTAVSLFVGLWTHVHLLDALVLIFGSGGFTGALVFLYGTAIHAFLIMFLFGLLCFWIARRL